MKKLQVFKSSGVRKQLIIALCVYLGSMSVGYCLGWTAPVIPKLQDPEQSLLPEPITETQMSLLGTILYAGAIPGISLTGLANRKGRKPCLMISGILCFIGYIVLATAKSLVAMYIGRALLGLGISVTTIMSLVYLGEIASVNIRGIILTGTGIFQTLGTLLVYSIGPYVKYSVINYIGVILSALYCIGIFMIPESPLYHLLNDNEDAAKGVLDYLGRSDDMKNFKALKDDQSERNAKDEWINLFTVKSNRRALFINLSLTILQHSSGVMAVVFFATTIFELAGSSVRPEIATMIIGVTQLCASLMAPMFVDRSGRKTLLLLSTAFCCFSLLLLGVYFYLNEINHSTAENLTWLPLVTLIAFCLSYGIGFSIIPTTLIGELFASNVRSTGSAISITTGLVFSFAGTAAFGSLITVLGGHGTFWIFSGVCALAFLFTLLYVPETKMKSFIEIQKMLSK